MDSNVRRRRNKTEVSNRTSLFQQQQQNTKGNPKTATTAAHHEAKSITNSLQRTKAMMTSELERVSHVTESIANDGKTIHDTKLEHLGIKDAVRDSRGSLGALKRREREERVVFWSAVVFFYLVVGYILWSRLRIPFLLW